MKTQHLLAPLATFCAVAALVGCASTNRQVSESWFDEQHVQPVEAPSSKGLSQPVFPGERAFRKLDLDTNGTVTLDEWQHFDTSAGAKENFGALDENGDAQIKVAEFLKEAPKHSKPYRFFGGTNPTDESFSLLDSEGLQQQGWQLFSIRF